MPLLTAADYDQIRGALDAALVGDTDTLPDATIGLAPFEPAAEAEVLRRVPGALLLAGDALAAAQRAVVYLAAARLAPTLPAITAESVQGVYQVERARVDRDKQAAALRALADAELAVALGTDDAAAEAPTLFALACGNRGGRRRWA